MDKKWPLKRRLAWVAALLVGMALLGAIFGKPNSEYERTHPYNGLTQEQRDAIVLDCASNPTALRCQ
jgi:hypothetical protein